MFKFIRKIYQKEEIKHWIFITKTMIYRTFISSSEHLPIYIKEGTILKGYQELFCLKYYLGKNKE